MFANLTFITHFILVFFCYLLSVSCSDTKAPEADVQVQTPPRPVQIVSPLTADSVYDAIGSLVAGTMTDSTMTSLYPGIISFLTKYRTSITDKFYRIEQERLSPMKEWNEGLMSHHKVPGERFVFYPFSGADLVHVHALFPKADRYFMVAMEPVGQIPDLMSKDTAYIRGYLESIDYILRDIYQKSYFITKNMIGDFGESAKVNGIAPILLWSLSRLGYQIHDVRYYTIDSAGQKQKVDAVRPMGRGLVELDFFRSGDRSVRTVSYLSCDASDQGFRSSPRYQKFLDANLPEQTNTFVKSASYLMHYELFSHIRSLCLDRSGYMIQDDTGIPYSFLKERGFKVRLFGAYEKPVRDFSSNLFQKDLDEAYQDSATYAGNLSFSLGYHWWGKRKQNQLVAIRSTTDH